MNCRHCGAALERPFLDLGAAPPSNAYLTAEDLRAPEIHYPLRLMVCTACWLVQTEDYARADELFSRDYAYFSSTSKSWLAHAARYAQMIIPKLGLGSNSFVIEVAANDGYLLKEFVAARVPCLGIEPTQSTAQAAREIGVPVLQEFFTSELAQKYAGRADLIIGNNVYAHVPDINDFTVGLRTSLTERGVVTLEFPHLMRMIQGAQFDTAYHEHFSYLSLSTVERVFREAGLRIFDVESIPTHGGSLRVYGCRAEGSRERAPAVDAVLAAEETFGLFTAAVYDSFQRRAEAVKEELLAFLLQQKREGRRVMGFGAAAKGNTLLNYAGVRPDLLPQICDSAPSKFGKFMPGSRIPIVPPSQLAEQRPDTIIILPWNIADEVVQIHAYAKEWGAKFYVAVPTLRCIA